ncbi:unnamed protein product, partial [Discosporangium mesarthrocarpum]
KGFQEFLRIPTISGDGPEGPYAEAVSWLTTFATEKLSIVCETVEVVEGKPIVVMSWMGSEPELPGVLLNSHYDVVPVMLEHWDTDPFAAVRDAATGRIYGRGAQDMKCVCIQYLEAVRRLQRTGFHPRRTLRLTFVPDEEIGGTDGMSKFLASHHWESLQPIGVALDEGLANPHDAYTAFYGERAAWWILVKATGPTGHGSRFVKDTAVEKLLKLCNKALKFRQEQEEALGHTGGCSHATAKTLGDVTTLNLTVLRAGVSLDGGKTYSINVVPTEAMAAFDVRITPNMPPEEFRGLLDKWCAEEGLSWEYDPRTAPLQKHQLTSTDRVENPWWGIFSDVMEDVGVRVESEVFPAATDSRFLRRMGVPAIGFSPMRNTPILLHDHNEYLEETVFLEGVGVYERLITTMTSAERMVSEAEA